jgi:hypothetical protein
MIKKILPIAAGIALMLFSLLIGCSTTSTSTTPLASSTLTTTTLPVLTASTQTPAPTTTQRPIEVIYVSGPLPPINPGGPIVEITLKNVSIEPVTSLSAIIELGRTFIFNFDVSSDRLLLLDNSISSKLTLIGGAFSNNTLYPLKINGILQSNAIFAYTVQIQIAAPTVLTSIIPVTPSPGAFLVNSGNISSQVLLKDVQVYKGVSDKRYSGLDPKLAVNAGEPVLVVSGSIQNKHPENKEIAMYAEGYNAEGKQVAWTLDAAHIVGQIGRHLEKDETGQFTLHLNIADNLKSIRIFANNYSITPP